jgi:glycine cleavage system pyridoxal-binding protein P
MAHWIPPDWEDKEMLAELGIASVEELFKDIPGKARIRKMGLPHALDEKDVVAEVGEKLGKNRTLDDFDAFLGGGSTTGTCPPWWTGSCRDRSSTRPTPPTSRRRARGCCR